MPIRETTWYRVTCDTCEQSIEIKAVQVANELPDGWTSQPRANHGGDYWFHRAVTCPDCQPTNPIEFDGVDDQINQARG
jgi:hypothetical protein